MNRQRTAFKKILALLLALTLTFAMFPAQVAYAAGSIEVYGGGGGGGGGGGDGSSGIFGTGGSGGAAGGAGMSAGGNGGNGNASDFQYASGGGGGGGNDGSSGGDGMPGTFGGAGGTAGTGATAGTAGVGGTNPVGGNGGNGAAGISTNDNANATTDPTSISVVAGNGGNGGNGGAGAQGGTGGNGGVGGNGGNASLTLTAANVISSGSVLVQSGSNGTRGSNGAPFAIGMGGAGGAGGSATLQCAGTLSAPDITVEKVDGAVDVGIGTLDVSTDTTITVDGTAASEVVFTTVNVAAGATLTIDNSNGDLTIGTLNIANGGNVVVSDPIPGIAVEPSITGDTSLQLTYGYIATSTAAYTIGGTPAPTVTQDTDYGGNIMWNAATEMLDITAGLNVGIYDVELTAANSVNSDATLTFTFTVNPEPDTTSPTVQGVTPVNGAQNVTTGAALTITFDELVAIGNGDIKIFKATDTINPVYTVTSPGALGMISPQSGANASYTITPSSALDADTAYYVTIDNTFFKDSAGNYFAGIADAVTWAFKTAAAPVLPTLTLATPTDDTATEGEVFTKTLSVTYTGIGTLGYSATGLPLGLSINTATGEISGTPDTGTSAGSPHTVNVGVTDGSLSDSGSFILTVDAAPVPPVLTMATPTDDTATAGDLYRKTVSVTYTGNNPLTYDATGLPGSLTINTATGEISGLLTESDVGTHNINVTVSDGALPDASGSFTLTVQTAIVPPPITHTVTFDLASGTHTGGGALVQSVPDGGAATAPTASRSGYTFNGWDKTFSNVTSDMTVTAQWSRNSTGGGSSGGSDSSSDTTPTYSVEVTTKPDYPTSAKTTLTGSPDKNAALSYTITKEMVLQALDKAKEEAKKQGRDSYGYSLEFSFSTTAAIDSLNITFNADALALLESAGIKETTVTTNAFRFGFDLAAIKELNKQSGGKAVTVSTSRFTKLSDAAKATIGSRPAWDITIGYKKDGKTEKISNLGKGNITMGMKYTPASGEKTGNLAVVYVPGSGKPQVLTNSSYAGGWMIWRRSSLSVYGVGYVTPAPAFTDTANHWAKDNIDFVVSRGLISGTSATTFSPDTAITRADFLMALGKLSGADVSGYTTSSFTDVANTSPAMPYIEWAVKNKIVQGIGDNKFGPDNKITREDMAVMMVNYAKATGYTLPVSRQAVTFADNDKISAYAKDAVKAIQQAGIIVGKTGNLFDPKASATRAEASTILRRFVELVIDEGTARGWVQNDAGQWQYINSNGKAVTGWLTTTAGSKYWFDDKGIMAAGKWVEIGGKWYYFQADGKLAVNTTIDGYEVGADGARKQ